MKYERHTQVTPVSAPESTIRDEMKLLSRGLASIAALLDAVGIAEEQIWRALGVAGERDLNVERAATLSGLRATITDGDTALDEAFSKDAGPPKFIPPRDDVPASAGGERRASAPSAAARLAHLVEACRLKPEAILDYINVKGKGTYKSLNAVPDSVLHGVVRAWPDVVAELAEAGMTKSE